MTRYSVKRRAAKAIHKWGVAFCWFFVMTTEQDQNTGEMWMPRKSLLALAFALACAGCAYSEPVVVIGLHGETLRGSATAGLTGGSFIVGDGKLACAGTYDDWSLSTTIEMPVLCSDGRKGIVTATRDASGMSGSGHVRLNDGSTADFIFGSAAANF